MGHKPTMAMCLIRCSNAYRQALQPDVNADYRKFMLRRRNA